MFTTKQEPAVFLTPLLNGRDLYLAVCLRLVH